MSDILEMQEVHAWHPNAKSFYDIKLNKIDYLWENWIPKGMLTMIEGFPKVGKSSIAIDIIARLSCGRPMPFESESAACAKSLIIAPEDPVDSVVKPRLIAAKTNQTEVYHYEGMIHQEKGKRTFWLEDEHIKKLAGFIELGNFQFVYIDAVMGLLGSRKTDREQDVRDALEPLCEVAHRLKIAIVLGRHWPKGAHDRSAIEKGIGSIAWSSRCRSIIQVGTHPEDDKIRLACQVGNLSEPQPARSFRLMEVPVEIENEQKIYTRVEWLDQLEGFDINSLGRSNGDKDGSKAQQAEIWLTSRLKEVSEIQSSQLKDEAKQQGHGKSAIETALKAMKESGHIRYEKRLANWWTIYTNYQPGDF